MASAETPLTVTEVSALIGVSPRLILNLLKAGSLKGFRLSDNGNHFVMPSSLLEYVEERKLPGVIVAKVKELVRKKR